MLALNRVDLEKIVVCLSLVFSAAANADPERGKMLYENHCRGCHESSVHNPSKRRATSLDGVRHQVGRWSADQGLGWDGEDITDVADYLGETFYQFK